MSRRVLRRRLGVFGGTFDPPHLAHLAIAERAREELRLDRVVLVPAADPPHKRGRVVTPFADRLAMTRLAVRGQPGFGVADVEGRRPGPSFTVDTLRGFARVHPGAELVLVIGEDSLDDLHGWHEPREMLALAALAVAPRNSAPGQRRAPRSSRLPARLARVARLTWLSGPTVDLSSTELRDRARRGRSLRFLVPDAVIAYARRRRLYRGRS